MDFNVNPIPVKTLKSKLPKEKSWRKLQMKQIKNKRKRIA